MIIAYSIFIPILLFISGFAKDDYITLGELEMLTAKQNFKP
jgi:hypothetical protein